jgi:hypothetical protein
MQARTLDVALAHRATQARASRPPAALAEWTDAAAQPALAHARGDAPTTCVNARENAAALA